MEREEVIARCYGFIRSIGIEIRECELGQNTFVPGITINKGVLLVDRDRMKYPGDLLHEAGHIALLKPDDRMLLDGDAGMGQKETEGYEMGVLVWSYFAALKTGVPLDIVFHPAGYKGQSDWLIENFTNKKYIGFPLLEWMRMAKRKEDGEVEIVSWMRA